MGSRAVVIACRDAGVARARFGVVTGESGTIVTRTGRRFFADANIEKDLVRAPARMLIAQRENRENDVLTGATRARIGPPALLDQAKRTKLPIAPQPRSD
jgi:hypothetical protein